MAERTRGYAHRIDVRASAAMVWRSLTDPAQMALWYGPKARVTPRAGGSYVACFDKNLEREAHIDVFEPGRRLRLIYMTPRDLPPSEAVMIDDFILDTDQDMSVLRLMGSGFPQEEAWDPYYQRVRTAWAQALARLKVLTEKQAAGAAPATKP